MNHSHLADWSFPKKELGNCIKCWECHQGRSTRQATKTILVEEFGDDEPKQIEICDSCWGDIATEQLWEYLTEGTPPTGYNLPGYRRPLSKRRAYTILYLVQEFLGGLPDKYGLCNSCELLFNTEEQHFLYTKSGHFCENCSGKQGQTCSTCEEGFDYEDLVEIDEVYYCKEHAKETKENA